MPAFAGMTLSGGFSYCVADAVDDGFYLRLVVAFGHHADDGLGARGADDEAARSVEFFLCPGDDRLNPFVFERLAAGEADIFEELRDGIEAVEHFAGRSACANELCEHLKRGKLREA